MLIKGLEGYRGVIPQLPNLLLLKYLDQGMFSTTTYGITPLFTNTYKISMLPGGSSNQNEDTDHIY